MKILELGYHPPAVKTFLMVITSVESGVVAAPLTVCFLFSLVLFICWLWRIMKIRMKRSTRQRRNFNTLTLLKFPYYFCLDIFKSILNLTRFKLFNCKAQILYFWTSLKSFATHMESSIRIATTKSNMLKMAFNSVKLSISYHNWLRFNIFSRLKHVHDMR